jgi:putative DNA primase/helicase
MIAQRPERLTPVEDNGTLRYAWETLRQLNPELPVKYSLTKHHEESLLASGITKTQAAIAGIFSVNADQGEEYAGHAYAGLIFSYFNQEGRLYQWTDKTDNVRPFFRLRPDNPKAPRYLSPPGSPTFVYLPRTANHQWCEGDSFASGMRLVITEGEKKALCATLSGIPCIGLGGVNSYATGERSATTGERGLGFLIDELNLLEQKRVSIVFDSDITQKEEVALAIKSFVYSVVEAYKSRELASGAATPRKTLRLGQILKYSLLPSVGEQKTGLDDAIVQFGVEPVQELLGQAMPLAALELNKEAKDDIDVEILFAPEPLGDAAKKKSPYHLQAQNRGLIAWLSLMGRYAAIPGPGYLKYNTDTGIWDEITRDQWANVPEQIANEQRWNNRTTGLQGQTRNFVAEKLSVADHDLNSPKYLGFLNGVLDLESRTLLPHGPSYYLTQRLGFDFSPVSNCDNWLNWLLWTFAEPVGDEFNEDSEQTIQTINLVRALLRWTLTPKQNEPHKVEAFPYLIGKPGRGKGTFLEVLSGLAGGAAGVWSLETIGDPNGCSMICSKLVSICFELKGVLSEKSARSITSITSNEQVPVKKLYRDLTYARCNTVLWAASNTSILSNLSDRAGVDRRAIYLEFKRAPNERDGALKHKLLAELPGIFNWVWGLDLDEAIQTIKEYKNSEQNLASQAEALAASNTVYQWMADPETNQSTLCTPEVAVRISEHYQKYTTWCTLAGCKPLGRNKFGHELENAGSKVVRKNNGIHYIIPELERVSISGMLGL